MIKLICPNCKSDKIKLIGADFFGDDILRCENCGAELDRELVELKEE